MRHELGHARAVGHHSVAQSRDASWGTHACRHVATFSAQCSPSGTGAHQRQSRTISFVLRRRGQRRAKRHGLQGTRVRYMFGGNDSNNTIVPVDAARYTAYQALRSGLTLTGTKLLSPIPRREWQPMHAPLRAGRDESALHERLSRHHSEHGSAQSGADSRRIPGRGVRRPICSRTRIKPRRHRPAHHCRLRRDGVDGSSISLAPRTRWPRSRSRRRRSSFRARTSAAT